ncbi:MAG: hypothetical protein H6774_00660 [Pseudomonadales bacterium]|nr:hypothetical protein [Candidatus Woesebacteria bacterium]MCB9801578.1 hypothetical protein [Pseudomonadales bacterium]
MLSFNRYASRSNNNVEVITAIGNTDNETYKLNTNVRGEKELTIYADGKKTHIYTYTYDQKGEISNLSLTIGEGAHVENVRDNDALTSLTVAKGARVRNISHNKHLTSLTIGEGAHVENVRDNDALTSLTIGEGASVKRIYDNKVRIPIFERIKYLMRYILS